MRILVAHNHYGDYSIGGEAMVFKQEVELLKENGYNVRTYERSNAELEKTNLLGKIDSVINIHWSKQTIEEVGHLMDDFKPDILHVHNYKFLITPSIFKAAKIRGIKTVLTLHNYRLMVPCGNFMTKDGVVCEKCLLGNSRNILIKRCSQGSIIKSYLQYRLHTKTKYKLNQLIGLVDTYIVLSQFAKEKLIISGVPEPIIKVKPNFVKDSTFDLVKKHERAVFVGRLSFEKGVLDLINKWEGIDYPLSIIGSGPLEKELKSIASKNPNIQFHGAMNNKDVLEFLSSSSFLVFPSTLYETFGLTIIEAFSLGLPVLASNLGPRSEIISSGVNGFLYNIGDFEDFQKKAEILIKDISLRLELGVRARESYERKYSRVENFKSLSNLYINIK